VKDTVSVAIDSINGKRSATDELIQAGIIWLDYLQQKNNAGLAALGQVAKDGAFPVETYVLADLGSTERLTYFFVDSSTGLRTNPGFAVSSVEWDALLTPPTLDPNALTEALIQSSLTPLGISTDSANDFAFDFTLQGVEPLIIGFPLDAAGNIITGEGTAGYAMNVLTPEPGTMALMALGVLGAAFLRKRMRRTSL